MKHVKQCPVAGVTFADGYPDNLYRLRELVEQARGHGAEMPTVVLVREPDNRYDPNAVRVDVPGVAPIGHIPRRHAVKLAQLLDGGGRYTAGVVNVRIHPDAPEQPGVDVGWDFHDVEAPA